MLKLNRTINIYEMNAGASTGSFLFGGGASGAYLGIGEGGIFFFP